MQLGKNKSDWVCPQCHGGIGGRPTKVLLGYLCYQCLSGKTQRPAEPTQTLATVGDGKSSICSWFGKGIDHQSDAPPATERKQEFK